MELSLATRTVGEHTVLEVGGEVDVYTAPRLRERLVELVDGGARNVVVDLGRVDFLDSTGLGVLVGALKRLRAANGTFGLVCAKEPLLKIFRITALDQVFPIYPSVEAATSTRPASATAVRLRDGDGPAVLLAGSGARAHRPAGRRRGGPARRGRRGAARRGPAGDR